MKINPLNLLYPAVCLHCEKPSATLICQGCASFFELIDPLTRCPFCFAENDGCRPCPECVQKKRWQVRVAASVDYVEAVQTVVKKLKYGRMPYLVKTAVSFILLQFERLGWDIPDLIVPVPRRLWFQGANHATLLAKGFGKQIGVTVHPCVGRRIGDLSQARLGKEQREELCDSSFYLKKGAQVEGKSVLLIDDVMTTGTTLRHTAETLKEGFPKKINALTFARAVI